MVPRCVDGSRTGANERMRGTMNDFQREGLGPWHLRGKSRNYGPFSLRQLRVLLRTGKLTERHQVSTDGTSWSPARLVPGLWGDQPATRGKPDWDRDVIVRVAMGRLNLTREGIDDILFVAPEGICFAQKRRNTALPVVRSAGLHDISVADSRFRRSVRRIRWEDIESAEVSWPCEAGAWKSSRRTGRDMCINVRGAPPIRMFVPHEGTARVVNAMRHRLGDRVSEGCEPFREPRIATPVRLLDVTVAFLFGPIVLFGILSLLLVGWILGYFRAVDSESGWRAQARFFRRIVLPPVILTGLMLPVFFFPSMLGASSSNLLWVYAGWWALAFVVPAVVVANSSGAILAFPRTRIKAAPARTTKLHWFERLCALWPRPWANRSVGVVLKLLAVLTAIATITVVRVLPPFVIQIAYFFGFTLALSLAFMGYRCSIGSALNLRASDKRPPIVFLRSFKDDGHGSFSVNDWRSALLGLTALDSGLAFLGPLANANPTRILRLLIGRGGDSAEEQLAVYVQNHGPFIAIGRPDEGLPTAGAARDYVDDDSWKQRVREWIREARLVIIQPGQTEGVRWEIEQVLDAISPQKVVFSLTSFDGGPEAYESFALWLRETRDIECPLYRGGAAFLSLDASRGVLEPLRTCPPMSWPIRGCSADFPAMLSHRLGSSAPAKQMIGWKMEGIIANLQVLIAALGWWLLTTLVVLLIGLAGLEAASAMTAR